MCANKLFAFLSIFILVQPALSQTDSEFRQWTDSTREFQVKAKLIDVPPGEGVVVLEKENGETLRVPIERLSTNSKLQLGNRTGQSVETIELDKLVRRRGRLYKANSKILFTGTVIDHHPNGQKESEATYKAGKQEGISINWYENGQKSKAGTIKDGKLEGETFSWHRNGQKESEGKKKAGKHEGIWTNWGENGKKSRKQRTRMARRKVLGIPGTTTAGKWQKEHTNTASRKEFLLNGGRTARNFR